MKLIVEKHINDDWAAEEKSQYEILAALIALFYEDPPELFSGAKLRIIGDKERIAVVREPSLAPQFSIDSEEAEDEDGS